MLSAQLQEATGVYRWAYKYRDKHPRAVRVLLSKVEPGKWVRYAEIMRGATEARKKDIVRAIRDLNANGRAHVEGGLYRSGDGRRVNLRHPDPPPGVLHYSGKGKLRPLGRMRPSARGRKRTFFVHRIDDSRPNLSLDNTNAGDVAGIVQYIQQKVAEKYMGKVLTTWKVTVVGPIGEYEYYGHSADRETPGVGKRVEHGATAYSFPKGGPWTARRVRSRPTDEVVDVMSKKATELEKKGVVSTGLPEDLPWKYAIPLVKKMLEK